MPNDKIFKQLKREHLNYLRRRNKEILKIILPYLLKYVKENKVSFATFKSYVMSLDFFDQYGLSYDLAVYLLNAEVLCNSVEEETLLGLCMVYLMNYIKEKDLNNDRRK